MSELDETSAKARELARRRLVAAHARLASGQHLTVEERLALVESYDAVRRENQHLRRTLAGMRAKIHRLQAELEEWQPPF